MHDTGMTTAAPLIRDIVRLYVREQRKQARCGDGASTVQCHVLTELLREEGLSQQALVERLGLDKGWISRAADALVSEGCISRQASATDRRSVMLFLTRAGRARAQQLEQELNRHASQLLERVPPEHRPMVQQSLQLLADALLATPSCKGALVMRPAAKQDWPAIKDMLLAEGLPPDGAKDHLAHFLVGEQGGQLASAGGLEVYGGAALLRSVVVAPEARGKGLAKRLLADLAALAASLGIGRLYLLTTTAESYFSGLGFRRVARSRIPGQLQQSREFQGACPASASAMVLRIQSPSSKTP
jgi:amino-acid N-acetyltransferase